MGAWGTTSFQSDAGLDFLHKLADNNEVKDSIERALESVICVSSFCSEIEAFAEIIAISYGKIECDEKYVNESDFLKAMEHVKYLETDKAYFEQNLAKVHYALAIIDTLNTVLWKEDSLEERKQYISKLSTAIEEIINDVKQNNTND